MAASVWLKHLLRWHWVSSAVALFGGLPVRWVTAPRQLKHQHQRK